MSKNESAIIEIGLELAFNRAKSKNLTDGMTIDELEQYWFNTGFKNGYTFKAFVIQQEEIVRRAEQDAENK